MNTPTSKPFILASGSPRRSFLLEACGLSFRIAPSNAPEDFDPAMPAEQVPGFLASRKAQAALLQHPDSSLILTADTVVILNKRILNKPQDEQEAMSMLKELSNTAHVVITAVALATPTRTEIVECHSQVHFLPLSEQEIINYVLNFRPLDKAGAYGAQECLPENYNPCSEEELKFLKDIGKPDLLQESKTNRSDIRPLIAIRKIEGSYFNVMGLPIHLIHGKINSILLKK